MLVCSRARAPGSVFHASPSGLDGWASLGASHRHLHKLGRAASHLCHPPARCSLSLWPEALPSRPRDWNAAAPEAGILTVPIFLRRTLRLGDTG